MTAEELADVSGIVGRYDLLDGQLIVSGPAGGLHGEVVANLAGLIGSFVRTDPREAYAGIGTGFILGRNPDTVLGPDIGVVKAGRMPSFDQCQGFLELVPDLVVEVVSFNDSAQWLETLWRRYVDAGVPLTWLVHPEQRTVTVYHADGTSRLLREHDTLDGEDVLPGLRLLVSRLFD
jgi:Uma2 family endonuclease